MPTNPFTKLLDRRKPLRADAEQAIAQLARLSEQSPDLAEAAATHAALLRATFVQGSLPVPTIILDPVQAAIKLEGGVPLLRGEQVGLNAGWLREQYLRLCDALVSLPPSAHDVTRATRAAPEGLRQAVKRGALDIPSIATDVLAGDPYAVVERATEQDLDAALAATLLRWTLLPILEQVAKQLQPLRKNAQWDKGYCPTCGAWPILGERRGIEQRLFLRCGLCASEWEIDRIFCPFCNSRNHLDIAYLYEEAQETTQRAMTCERCHGYYKTVTTLSPLSTPQLFVTDLATLYLDLIALDRAYGPPM